MLDADKSHLDVTWVSQSLYSGPLSNPDFFLSLIAGRIRQVVLYNDHLSEACVKSQINDHSCSKRSKVNMLTHIKTSEQWVRIFLCLNCSFTMVKMA